MSPGGVIAIYDSYPMSEALRNLNPAIYVLRGITVRAVTGTATIAGWHMGFDIIPFCTSLYHRNRG